MCRCKPKGRERNVYKNAALIAALLLFPCLVWLFPCVVWASSPEAAHGEHNEHGTGIPSFLWTLINFGIYCYIIFYLYRTKMAPLLRERSIEFQQFLQRAGAELATVEREIAAVNQQLARLDQERDAIIRQLDEEG